MVSTQKRVRITHNTVTRLARRLVGVFSKQKPEYLTKKELERIIKYRQFEKLDRVFLFCDQKRTIELLGQRIDALLPWMIRKGDTLLLKVLVMYSADKAVAAEALKALKESRSFTVIAELVKKAGSGLVKKAEPEKLQSECLHFLEDNLAALAREGNDFALITVKAHTNREDIRTRVTGMLPTNRGIIQGLSVLMEKHAYRKIVDLLFNGQLDVCRGTAIVFLEKNVDRIIATKDAVVINFLLKETGKEEIKEMIRAVAPEVVLAQEAD